MKKYMLVYVTEDGQFAMFSDDMKTISQSKMDIECGLGGCAEIYKRVEDDDFGSEYRLLFS